MKKKEKEIALHINSAKNQDQSKINRKPISSVDIYNKHFREEGEKVLTEKDFKELIEEHIKLVQKVKDA